MQHNTALLKRAVDILDKALWEHQPWEAEMRSLLEEYNALSDDYTLSVMMEYAFPDRESLTEASREVQRMYEENPDAYNALVDELLEYVDYLQKSQDRLHKVDYGWEKEL